MLKNNIIHKLFIFSIYNIGTNNLASSCALATLTPTVVTGFTTTMSTPPSTVAQKNGVTVDVGDGRMSQLILSGPGKVVCRFKISACIQ